MCLMDMLEKMEFLLCAKEMVWMIRVGICDDEPTFLEKLTEYIYDQFMQHGEDVCTDKFTSGSEFLDAHKSEPFDVVFLDIRMSDINGFDIALKIRSLSDNVYIIFITTENALVYESFCFQPFDFIPKVPPSNF